MQYEGPYEKFSLDTYREKIAKKLSGKETWLFIMMKDISPYNVPKSQVWNGLPVLALVSILPLMPGSRSIVFMPQGLQFYVLLTYSLHHNSQSVSGQDELQ